MLFKNKSYFTNLSLDKIMLQKIFSKNMCLKIISLLFVSLMLSGCLETMFAGTAGTAMEFAKDRPAGDTLTDVRIATAIKGSFIKNNFRDLYTKIKTEVVMGRVLFTGTIDKEDDAIKAVEIAWSQEGVKEVINELKIDKNSSKFDLLQYTRDTMITSQIKSKIFINRDIKFSNYTVITLNDIVYLFGIARSEEELEKVASLAANVHGVEKVVSHTKVQNTANKMRESKDTESNNDYLDEQTDNSLNNEGI